MHWFIVIAYAAVFGWLVSLVTRRYGMGPVVTVPVSVLGGCLGGGLDRVTNAGLGPGFAFYSLAVLLSLLATVGGSFAFLLTSSERRV